MEFISFVVNRVTSIRCSTTAPAEPYRHYDDLNIRVSTILGHSGIFASFENASKLLGWILSLYAFAKVKGGGFELEDQIHELMMQKENKKGFNMSLIKSVSEKPLHEETNIFVRRILPLNHVYGYMFVTDVMVYFEPFHSLLGKSVHTIEITDIAKLFKRRFELQEVRTESFRSGWRSSRAMASPTTSPLRARIVAIACTPL